MTPAPAPRIGRGLGTLLQLGATVLVTAVLLGLIEIAARLAVGPPPARTAPRLDEDTVDATMDIIDLMPDVNPVPLVNDPILLWRNKPGARKTQPVNPRPVGSEATWTLADDARGYRGSRPAPAVDGESVFRVLCIGDSVTFGFNVDQDAAYPQQLERRLREHANGGRVEVINAGVPGWSWVQGRTFLETEGLGLRPNVVVIGHGTNDQFFLAKVTDVERIGAARSRLGRLRTLAARLLAHTGTYRAVQRITNRDGDENTPSPGCRAQIAATQMCRRVSVPEITQQVHAVREFTAANGIDLVVVNLDFMQTPAVTGVRPAVAADGIPFLDLVQDFTERRAAADARRATALGLVPPSVPTAAAPPPHRRALLRVHATGGGTISVSGGVSTLGLVMFDQPMFDDGTHGDERAGDEVFTAAVEVSGDLGVLDYRFARDGQPELVSPPPLLPAQNPRALALDGEAVVAPVAEFGTLFLMAERTHPNAEGQAIIADRIAAAIRQLPSFQAFTAARGA